MRLKKNGTGGTMLAGAQGSSVAVGFIGYLGPSAFGLIAAALIAHGLIVATLWIGVVLLLLLLPTLRGVFSVAVVAGFGALLFLVVRYGPSLIGGPGGLWA